MSDQREIYERDRENPYYEGRHTHRKEGFFERNCDEAWEQVKETFSHPGRLFAKVLLIALLCGVVAGGSYLLKIRAPELPSKDTDSKNNNSEQIDGIDYGDGVRSRAAAPLPPPAPTFPVSPAPPTHRTCSPIWTVACR